MTKKIQFLMMVAAGAGMACQAQELGRVITSTPVVQQVSVPRQVCSTEQVEVAQPKSGAGALVGAIAGGAIGNQLGKGAGNVASTMLGMVGGALVGDRIEGAPAPQIQNMQRCETQSFVENRTVAYNVVYEYAGRQYSVQMPNDPGPTIALQVSPLGAQAASAAPAPVQPVTVTSSPVQPVYVQPAPVVVAPAATYYYAQPYYYPPVSLNFGFGYWQHGHHWH